MIISLEKEFEENVRLHKIAILKKMMYRYYYAMETSRANSMPDFLIRARAERLANQDVTDLYLNNKPAFEERYNMAYDELKGEIE